MSFNNYMKKLKCMSLVLSIFLLAGCGASKSDINECVRYNTDRYEEREFDRLWEKARGFHEACNNLERALGGTECKSPKPRLRSEAREAARDMSSVLKSKCSEDMSFVY